MQSITTTTGDKGQTSLNTGERVWKDDLRVDAYGTLDELDAHLSEVKHYVEYIEVHDILAVIQNDLYHVMGELASPSVQYYHPLNEQDIDTLTELIHRFESMVELKGFVVLGGCLASAKLDVCRAVARRAERRIIALTHQEVVSKEILQYINRLSDLLYIIARWIEKQTGTLLYREDFAHGGSMEDNSV